MECPHSSIHLPPPMSTSSDAQQETPPRFGVKKAAIVYSQAVGSSEDMAPWELPELVLRPHTIVSPAVLVELTCVVTCEWSGQIIIVKVSPEVPSCVLAFPSGRGSVY